MSLNITYYSIVIKKSAINDRFAGGWEAFKTEEVDVEYDDEIVLFWVSLDLWDTEEILEELYQKGFIIKENDEWQDCCVIEENKGIIGKCNWLDYDIKTKKATYIK